MLPFCQKVVMDFHLSAEVVLPDFFPEPHTKHERLLHTLDVKCALLFYLDRPRASASTHHLFLTHASHIPGQSVSSQHFSHWITAMIALCYDLEKVLLPGRRNCTLYKSNGIINCLYEQCSAI